MPAWPVFAIDPTELVDEGSELSLAFIASVIPAKDWRYMHVYCSLSNGLKYCIAPACLLNRSVAPCIAIA